MMGGWIKIYQTIREHWIWERPRYLKWWLDLLMLAEWKDSKRLVKSVLVTIKRGQLIASVHYLQERWVYKDDDGVKRRPSAVSYTHLFSKTLYVTVEDMAAYAKRYSPSVKKETTVAQLIAKANDGIIGKKVGWEGNFNDMALKTVIRRLLSKYGYLSVEMQNAMAHDVEDEAMSNRNEDVYKRQPCLAHG